jgi:hypothetical protein
VTIILMMKMQEFHAVNYMETTDLLVGYKVNIATMIISGLMISVVLEMK